MPFPLLLSGAAATVGGTLSSVWSYNRDNYMWDWQVRQCRDYQVQNMAVNRFSLFREDIRDLAALTTEKMDSYLVVNTLKLGFVIQLHFNYDEVDQGSNLGYFSRHVSMMQSVCFMCSFFFLLMSIWYSMHADVVANTFMTKMLVQTVRLPMPTDVEIDTTVPEASDYETDLASAFRMPLVAPVRRVMETTPDRMQGRRSTPALEMSPITERGTYENLFGSEYKQSDSVEGPVLPGHDGLAPHVKLYARLMSNWLPFDLYSKISMSIGTSTMLAGTSYFAIFFMRIPVKDTFEPTLSGWMSSVVLVALELWSVLVDLVLSKKERIVMVLFCAAAPMFMVVGILTECQYLLPVVFVFQGAFFILMGCSAIHMKDGRPHRWRASLFLNVLDTSKGGDPCFHGILGSDEEIKDAPGVAIWLQQCLEAVLHRAADLRLTDDEVLSLARVRTDLKRELRHRKAIHKNRTLDDPAGGFWLETTDCPDGIWISLGKSSDVVSNKAAYRGTVAELLDSAQRTANVVQSRTPDLNAEEVDALAQYGGYAATAREFEAPFRRHGMSSHGNMGDEAHRFFRGSVMLMACAWLVACMWCSWDIVFVHYPLFQKHFVRPDHVLPVKMPRPWLMPTQLSCSVDGEVAVSDGMRIFTADLQGDRLWHGPFRNCDTAFSAFAHTSNGHLAAVASGSALLTLQDIECHTIEQSVVDAGSLEALAFDAGNGQDLAGVALRENQLLALEVNHGHVEISGRLTVPANHTWISVSVHDGRILLLNDAGALFEFIESKWSGPMWLSEEGVAWSSICAVQDGWIALGRRAGQEANLWRFRRRLTFSRALEI